VTYSALRRTSITGLDQIGAPDGPHICVPTLFFFVGCACSAIV